MPRLAFLLILLLFPLALVAEDTDTPYGVGDTIDDHAVEHWINPPAWNQFSDLQGEVIVFKKWGCT
ncbi:MAG: hypothetical protein R3E76_07015 [Planctomycetota bacterium]